MEGAELFSRIVPSSRMDCEWCPYSSISQAIAEYVLSQKPSVQRILDLVEYGDKNHDPVPFQVGALTPFSWKPGFFAVYYLTNNLSHRSFADSIFGPKCCPDMGAILALSKLLRNEKSQADLLEAARYWLAFHGDKKCKCLPEFTSWTERLDVRVTNAREEQRLKAAKERADAERQAEESSRLQLVLERKQRVQGIRERLTGLARKGASQDNEARKLAVDAGRLPSGDELAAKAIISRLKQTQHLSFGKKLRARDIENIRRHAWALEALSEGSSNPHLIACFDLAVDGFESKHDFLRMCESATMRGFAKARLKLAFQAANEGALRYASPTWTNRLFQLEEVSAGERLSEADYLLLVFGACQRLENPNDRLNAYLELASHGSRHAAVELVYQPALLDGLHVENAILALDALYLLGSESDRWRVAHELRRIVQLRGLEIPKALRGPVLDWLDDMDRRIFAIQGSGVGSDRAAMLGLADAFENARGATLIGHGDPGTNLLDTGWKQALFWRRRVVEIPLHLPLSTFEAQARDDLDRAALIGIASQLLDGRGAKVNSAVAKKLLSIAAQGDSMESHRSSLLLGQQLIAAIERKRGTSCWIIPEDDDLGDDLNEAIAALEVASESFPCEAGFEIGRLAAAPLTGGTRGGVGAQWTEVFETDAAFRLTGPAERYMIAIESAEGASRFSSDAAQALVARHFLGLLPIDFIDSDLLRRMCAAIARKPKRSALSAIAADLNSSRPYRLTQLRLPEDCTVAIIRSSNALSDWRRHIEWTGAILLQFEKLGGDYNNKRHLRFLQLHSELADLERRADAVLWNTVAVRASIRANERRIAPKAGAFGQTRPKRHFSSLFPTYLYKLVGTASVTNSRSPKGLTFAEIQIDAATRDVGIPLNSSTDSGIPLGGHHISYTDVATLRDYQIDIFQDRFRLSFDRSYRLSDKLLTLEDIEVAAALVLFDKDNPGFSLESIRDFEEGFVDLSIPLHLAQKQWLPTWLGETSFGKTLYYADYLISLSAFGRDLFSLSQPFVTAETLSSWDQPSAWRTAERVGGFSLTQSNRFTLIPREITAASAPTPIKSLRNRFRPPLHSFKLGQCNIEIGGGGMEDTPTEKVRDIGTGDIRFHIARSAYFRSVNFKGMIEEFPVFGRYAYLQSIFVALNVSKDKWCHYPALRKRLEDLRKAYQDRAEKRIEDGDFGYVILRGR